MIELPKKDVDKYDKISKELSALEKDVAEKKEFINGLIEALKKLEKGLDNDAAKISDLQTATEKEVLRYESTTINDDSTVVEMPAPAEEKKAEEKPAENAEAEAPKNDSQPSLLDIEPDSKAND